MSEVSAGAAHRRVKTPTLLQLEAVECGAASLGMILGYYGRIESLAVLRRECGVSRDGSKASSVVKAARRYGLLAKGFSKDVDQLRQLKPPFIVFWNFNHFLVVEGFGKDEVFLNDPAYGHRRVDAQEFSTSFTGVVLVMEPGPAFRRGGRRPSLATAVAARMRGSWSALAYCVLAGLLLVAPGLAIPAFNQIFIDNVIIEGRVDWLRPLILVMVLAVLAQALTRLLQLRYLTRLKLKLAITLSSRFMWHMLQLPAAFYAQRFPGEVANRSRLNDKLANVLSGKLAQTLIDAVMAVFYAALMFFYDVVLTLIGVGFALVNVAVLQWISRRRIEANMRVHQDYGKAQGVAIAGLQNIETIKAAGMEPGFFARWSGYYAKGMNAQQDLELSGQALNTLPGLLTNLTFASILIVGGVRVINGELSIGSLVAFQLLMTSFMTPVNGLVDLGRLIQELHGDLQRVNDVLDYPLPTQPQPLVSDEERPDSPRLKGYIELSDVRFGYNPLEAPLIEDLDLKVMPGQWIALVGGSGSGKSTIARLITGAYQPWSGEVLFDGVPREQIPREKLTRSLAVVEQDIVLFGGSVRENLTLWDDTVPDDDLVRACQDAMVHQAVRQLYGGYDSLLLEGGANLSGGQRQRLEIARALVSNPSMLVLDEATSALDPDTEKLVMERLRARGCSCIVVAHRLSTIRDCDEIIVLERGRVIERGDHHTLWSAEGAYAALLRADEAAVAGELDARAT